MFCNIWMSPVLSNLHQFLFVRFTLILLAPPSVGSFRMQVFSWYRESSTSIGCVWLPSAFTCQGSFVWQRWISVEASEGVTICLLWRRSVPFLQERICPLQENLQLSVSHWLMYRRDKGAHPSKTKEHKHRWRLQ